MTLRSLAAAVRRQAAWLVWRLFTHRLTPRPVRAGDLELGPLTRASEFGPIVCGRRFDGSPVGSWPIDPPHEDRWRTGGGLVNQGTVGRSCSHCGSLNPDTLLEKLRDGWILEGSDKAYKWYLARPYTPAERAEMEKLVPGHLAHMEGTHAMPGGVTVAKAYTVHLTRRHCEELLAMMEAKTLNHSLYVRPWLPALADAAPSWLADG